MTSAIGFVCMASNALQKRMHRRRYRLAIQCGIEAFTSSYEPDLNWSYSMAKVPVLRRRDEERLLCGHGCLMAQFAVGHLDPFEKFLCRR